MTRTNGWVYVFVLVVVAVTVLWALRLTFRRNRMSPNQARDAVRGELAGAECVHIHPRGYPLPPLEIIRIATRERGYVYAGSGRQGVMAFRRGDVAASQRGQGTHAHAGTRPSAPDRSYARGVIGDLKQHGYWPGPRRRSAPLTP